MAVGESVIRQYDVDDLPLLGEALMLILLAILKDNYEKDEIAQLKIVLEKRLAVQSADRKHIKKVIDMLIDPLLE